MTVFKEIQNLKNKEIAEHSQRFFKTGKGEYGEGDKFLGIRVPVLRKLAKKYEDLDKKDRKKLIQSKWHEERMLGLFILVNLYIKTKKKNEVGATLLYEEYISYFSYINNWDLVDTTCHKIIGPELFDKDKKVLYKWAKSQNLWTRRISMMTTYYFIKRDKLDDTLSLAKILLKDKEDLIHKVVGWMLRELGKKDKKQEDAFIRNYQKEMPRTMLRYAIEKYPANQRKKILAGKF